MREFGVKPLTVDLTSQQVLARLGMVITLMVLTIEAHANPIDDYLFTNNVKLVSAINLSLPNAPRMNWLEDPELRIAPELDSNNQLSDSYRIRFRASSHKERSSARKLFQTETELFNARWDKSLNVSLISRYQNIIELARQEVSLSLVEQQLILERSLFEPEAMASLNSNQRAADLQSAALVLEQLDRQHQSELRRTAALRDATVASYLNDVESTEPRVSLHLIRPEEIAHQLNGWSNETRSQAHSTKLAALEVARAQQALALEMGRTGFGLNLVEFRYDNKDIDSYVLNFGFRLPFSRSTQEVSKRTRDLLVAQREESLAVQVHNDIQDNAIRAIRWQIDAYSVNEDDLLSISERIQSPSDLQSLAVLHRYRLKLLKIAANTHINLLHDYIDLLSTLGVLQGEQQINWLGGN